MKFSRDDTTELTIRRIEAGAITIGDERLTGDVALTAERILRDWHAPAIAELRIEHLDGLLADQPEVVVLGTGRRQQFPPRELTYALARRGIGLETMDTAAACRTFNILVGEGRRPAAVLVVD